MHPRVVVQKHDVIAGGHGGSLIVGGGEADVRLVANDPGGGNAGQDLACRIVGRAVVDNDDFRSIARIGLPPKGVEALAQVGRTEGRQDDNRNRRQLRRHVAAVPRLVRGC